MRIDARITHLSAEIRESGKQVEAVFGPILERIASRLPAFSFAKLALCLELQHPSALAQRLKESGSYSASTATFFASAQIQYHDWVAGGWAGRVVAFQDAAVRAAKAIHKTRITEQERSALVGAILAASLEAEASTPETLAEIRPVRVAYDPAGKVASVQYDASPQASSDNAKLVQPQDAGTLADAFTRKSDPAAFKLYRTTEDGRLYHEAWPVAEGVVEHWGRCGERGETKIHPAPDQHDQQKMLDRLKVELRRRGFRPMPLSKHAALVASAPIDGFGSEPDLQRRHALEEFLNQELGWLGLGHCDGGSAGGSSMEVFCLVVDRAVGREAVAAILSSSGFSDFSLRPAGGGGKPQSAPT